MSTREPDALGHGRERQTEGEHSGLGSLGRRFVGPSRLGDNFSTNPARILAVGFLAAIGIGTLILMLPVASQPDGSAPFLTALFTSTSAVCVTGLIVVDTPEYWSIYGQAALLVLFQVGGFGILTGTSLAFLALTRKIGFRGRLMASAERQQQDAGQLKRVLAVALVVTVVVEAAAWVSITVTLLRDGYSVGSAVWRGLFHAVSAFNGAGFALWTDSVAGFATNGQMLMTIAIATIIGGIGVPVWLDARRERLRWTKYSLHTKLTLSGTIALLSAGFVALTISEWDNPDTLGALGVPGKLLGGFFASVTPRSAGFSTFDYGQADVETLLVTDALMFIGGGSASTAGGVKVGTFVLLMLVVWSEARGRDQLDAFARTVPSTVLRRAFSVAFLALVVVAFGTLTITASGPVGLEDALFEATSAFATVGLSTGITPDLDAAGQMTVIVLMYAGRVGLVTVALALAFRDRGRQYSYPEERPLVG